MSNTKLFTLQASFDVAKMINSDQKWLHALKYQNRVNSLLRNEGKRNTIKVLKGYYLIAVRFSIGQPYKPVPFRKSDKNGFPRDIRMFKKDLQSPDYRKRQAVLTILRSYVQLYLPIDSDTSSITTPGPDITKMVWRDKWLTFVVKWTRKFAKPVPDWDIKSVHGSTKSGPNGPALLWAHTDAISLYKDKTLFSHFERYNLLMKQEDLTEYTKRVNLLSEELQHKPFIHSKLSFLSEGGGKTRVVAIGDYWTQEALKGLHRSLFGYLRQLRTDGTYDQNRVASITRDMTRSQAPAFCFDLSNATDRFPVLLQEDVIGCIIGKEAAEAWRLLLVDRTFRKGKEYVKYSVGQPMGLFTSWAAFTLTHHAIIEFAAYLEGFNHFEDYVVLGDDVAIFNSSVAHRYETLLLDLEVPISKDKSTISHGPPNSAGEIAKRYFINGIEVSPIPPDIIIAAKKDPLDFPMLVRTMLARGIQLSISEAGTLLSAWFPKPERFYPLLNIPPGLPGHIKWPEIPSNSMVPHSNVLGTGKTNFSCWDGYPIEEITRVLLRKRLKALTEKVERMQTLHRRITTNKRQPESSTRVATYRWLQSKGVPIPNSALDDSIEQYSDMMRVIPLTHVIQKELMNLFQVMFRLEDADPDIVGSLDPKEFIPDISVAKYLGTFHKERSKMTSHLMLDTLRDLEAASKKN